MQLSKRSVIIIVISVLVMFTVILFLAFKVFQKDASLEVYKTQLRYEQKALLKLEQENKVLVKEARYIDSALAVAVSDRSEALIDLDKTNRQPIIIKPYEDKITDIRTYGSPELYSYFTNLR